MTSVRFGPCGNRECVNGQVPHYNPGTSKCSHCHGFKVISTRSYRAYANERTAATAVANGKASDCYSCKGTGETTNPATMNCYTCQGTGNDVTEAHAGDVFPEGFDLTRHVPKDVLPGLLQSFAFEVRRYRKRELSWGATHLGLGTVYTSVDYGRALQHLDAQIIDDVLEHIGSSLQWCKIATREDRTITPKVIIVVTETGYAVTCQAASEAANRAVLPPTYTEERLNGPAYT